MLCRYRDLNFSVIPVIGKRAVISDWSRWCLELPPMSLVEEWDRQFPFPQFGIALCAGPASNIDALDIDSDSEDILTICPRSPVSRVGARGAMPLFQHNPEIIKRKQDRDNLTLNEIPKPTEGIQILSTGNYLILPPSVHPDTLRPYRWIGQYTLENFSAIDLDVLSQEDVDRAAAYISTFPLAGKVGKKMGGDGGRNNKLTIVCCAILRKFPHRSNDSVAEELLSFDTHWHPRPYFSDPNEMYFSKAQTPFRRALLFVDGSRKRLQRKAMA